MNKSRKIYSVSQLVSAIIMIMALMWLTVSTPFVYACQQELAKQQKMEKTSSPVSGSEEETTKRPNSNTEEKTPGNTSLSEEYLHNHHKSYYSFAISMQYQKCDNAVTYIAYHGELLVPPPNVL